MSISKSFGTVRHLAVGAGLALAIAVAAAPAPALAADRVGTTDVLLSTNIDNVAFKVPTVIPFVANADGTLQGPSPASTKIENLSVYGIHVTNMKVASAAGWNLEADPAKGTATNSIDYKVGPASALQDAHAASQGTGIDLSGNAAFDMKYKGVSGGGDVIQLSTSGTVARVINDIYHVGDKNGAHGTQVGTITWTVEPGAHVS